MRVLVGDETGLLKSIELEKEEQSVISSRKESQARKRAIQRICWYEDENQDASAQENVVIARANGGVECYDARHGKNNGNGRDKEWEFTAPLAPNGVGKTVGIGMIQQFGSIIRCSSHGDVWVKNTVSKNKPTIFSVGNDLERMRVDPFDQRHIAIGGKERDLNIWSLERQEAIFKAKNVTHDNLDMRVPVWVKDLRFLSRGNSNGHRIVLGTGYHHVRIYDTSVKRRPLQQIEFGENPIVSICVSPDENALYIGDTCGHLDALDMRMNLRHLGRFTGPVGSIRDIACHPTLPYLAAVGLDRMVHVFNTNTRKYAHMVYAKQRLNTVLFCQDGLKEAPKLKEPSNKKQRTEEEEETYTSDDDEEEIAYEGLEVSEEEQEDEEDEEDEDDEEDSD
jgi:ribosome biogenesis protein NSA1